MPLAADIAELEIVDTDFMPYEDSEKEDKLTHIVNPPANMHIYVPGMKTQEIVDIARATGQHVVCLCGATFVPVRDPERYPVCEECVRIAHEIDRSMNDDS